MIADIDETRLTLGELLGADEALRGTGEEIAKAVLARTGGVGADAVFDAVGRAKTVAESIESVRKGGTVTLIGNIEPEVVLPLQKVVSRQIRIQGTTLRLGIPASDRTDFKWPYSRASSDHHGCAARRRAELV